MKKRLRRFAFVLTEMIDELWLSWFVRGLILFSVVFFVFINACVANGSDEWMQAARMVQANIRMCGIVLCVICVCYYAPTVVSVLFDHLRPAPHRNGSDVRSR